MECRKKKNANGCTCLHTECSRHGVCCECLRYHLGLNQLPACCFPKEISDTDERNISKFAEINS